MSLVGSQGVPKAYRPGTSYPPGQAVPYDERLLAWFAGLTPSQRLEVALDADEFLREARDDLRSRHFPVAQ